MTKEERLEKLFELLNEGKISEEAYDAAVSNINNFVYEEEED